MATLHIFSKSPFKNETCFDLMLSAISKEHDSLLLLDAGVYAASKSALKDFAADKVFYMASDLTARGLTPANLNAIGMTDFVALTEEHDKSITWC